MSIQFRCGCGHLLTVPVAVQGQKVTCPACQGLTDAPRLVADERIIVRPPQAGTTTIESTPGDFSLIPLHPAGFAQSAVVKTPAEGAGATPTGMLMPPPRHNSAPSPVRITAPPASSARVNAGPALAAGSQPNRAQAPIIPMSLEDAGLAPATPLDPLDPLDTTDVATLPPARSKKKRGQKIDWTNPVTLSLLGGGGLLALLMFSTVWMLLRRPYAERLAQTQAQTNPTTAGSPAALASLPPSAPSLAPLAPASTPIIPPPLPVVSPPAALASSTPSSVQPPPLPTVPELPTAPRAPIPTGSDSKQGESGADPTQPDAKAAQPPDKQPDAKTPAPKVPDPDPKAANPKEPPDPDGKKPNPDEVSGEFTVSPLDPTKLANELPTSGKVTPGGGRLVVANDEHGQPAVAMVHVQVDDTLVVMLPSGRLTTVKTSAVSETERPFKAMPCETLLAQLEAGRFKGYKTSVTKHYGFVYDCSDYFIQTVQDILETAHEGVVKTLVDWDLPVSEPNVPLVVLVFKDRKAFNEFQRMPDGVLAYYSILDNFIVMHEEPQLSEAAPEYALKRASNMIAHEGVHQILHNVGVQQRLSSWPAWLTEGLPEYFCPMRITSNMVKKGEDSLPTRRVRWNKAGIVNDLRMRSLLMMPQAGGQVVETLTQGDGQLTSAGYAMAWGMTHYLATKHSKIFRAYLKEVAATPPLSYLDPEQGTAQDKLFVKHWGESFASMEAGLARYLTSHEMQASYRDPLVYQTYYVVVHSALRGRAAQVRFYITTSPDGARKWKESQEKFQDENTRHTFRTQICETLHEAELMVAKLQGR